MIGGRGMNLRIAIDTGGTFTDVVAINEATGAQYAIKTPSTPSDPSVGLLTGLRKAAEAAGVHERSPAHRGIKTITTPKPTCS